MKFEKNSQVQNMVKKRAEKSDTETDNEALREWCKNICKPEYCIVDGLVANFVEHSDDHEYAKKLLKVLK